MHATSRERLAAGISYRCPRCRAPLESVDPIPTCSRCGFQGRRVNGILDLVDASLLGEHDSAELEAQRVAAEAYYENSAKISFHWERLDSAGLPGLVGEFRGQILDLGCATGGAGAAFKATGAHVVGVDYALDCLEKARDKLDTVLRANALALPFADDSFDALVCRGLLHHMVDVDGALREAWRVLKPGAVALFLDPRAFGWLEPIKRFIRRDDDAFSRDHHAFDIGDYEELLRGHFAVEFVKSLHPVGIVFAVGLDLLPLPRVLPKRRLARAFYELDRHLNRTPARRLGHLIVARVRKV